MEVVNKRAVERATVGATDVAVVGTMYQKCAEIFLNRRLFIVVNDVCPLPFTFKRCYFRSFMVKRNCVHESTEPIRRRLLKSNK